MITDVSAANAGCQSTNPTGLEGGYARASLAIADAIGSHSFDLREWLVLDFIRRQSFGAGRLKAYIPRLEIFAAATRISRGNVSALLNGLKRALVIEERPQWHYGFTALVGNWKVPLRLEQVEVIRQLELIQPPEHLRDAMLEGFVEQCRQGKPGWEPGRATGPAPGPAEDGVPESGTPVLGGGRTRIGYGDPSPVLAVGYGGVPESGTAIATMQQCNNVSSKEHCNNVASVPESGTRLAPSQEAGGSEGTKGGFDGERQRLFDELEQAGALGKDRESRGCWIGMVTQRPRIVRELLGELKYARVTRRIGNPGGWMMDKWKRWGRPAK